MFRAVHRKPTVDPQTKAVTGYEYGQECGHFHRELLAADDCVNPLADKIKLKVYEAVVVIPTDRSLSSDELAQLAARWTPPPNPENSLATG